LSTECVYVRVAGQHSPEVSGTWQCCTCRNQGLQNCALLNGFILQNLVSVWSFWLKNMIKTIYFVRPFKCDRNPAVSIMALW